MKHKPIRTALIALLAAVFLCSVVMMIYRQIEYRRIIDDRDEVAQIAGLQKGGESRRPEPSQPVLPEEREEEAEPLPEEAAGLADVDLEALRAVNEDVVGWIAIPGTDLSYPLMQGGDNHYYLSHNWKKESSIGGAVFLESTSSRDLTDFHTIVFAHRMLNDTMFGTLKYYNDADFWREHPHVYIVTDGGVYRYEIFSAQEADVKGIVYRLNIRESGLEEEYIQYCVEGSVIETGITPSPDDRFLVLSTCTEIGYANRWVVHGRLAQVYEVQK